THNGFRFHPPGLAPLVCWLVESPTVKKASLFLVVAVPQRIVEEGAIEIQKRMIGNSHGVARIYQQPDIFEIMPVGDTRKISFQPRSPVTLIFVGASSQSFAYHRVALNVDQFQKSLSCQR